METINSMATAAAKSVWGTQENRKTSDPQTDDQTNPPDTTTTTTDSSEAEEQQKKQQQRQQPDTTAQSPALPPQETRNSQDESGDADDTATADDNNNDGGGGEPKLSGEGPRPLAEVAREHGGDAGLTGKAAEEEAGSAEEGEEEKDGARNKKQKEEEADEAKGTGERRVRSSGLHADGGDFDAAKPGAGKEADRLMAEKGIHTSKADDHDDRTADESGDGSKPSLGKRIKAKFHKD